jgi:hypothetical protein
MCGDRRPVSQLHSADDVPELMRRAMRSLVRAEELAKELGRVSDTERDTLHVGFLALVRRYVVHLRDDGNEPACVANRLREELDDSLMPFNVRHHYATLFEDAERCVHEVFAAAPAPQDGMTALG